MPYELFCISYFYNYIVASFVWKNYPEFGKK